MDEIDALIGQPPGASDNHTEMDPLVQIDSYVEMEAAVVRKLAQDLRLGTRRICFYAGGAFDWQPLHRFTHLADVFVYVDPRSREDAFRSAMQRLIAGQTMVGDALVTDRAPTFDNNYCFLTQDSGEFSTGELSEMRNEPWTAMQNLQARQGWGAAKLLKRRVGGVERDIWLIYIAGSPLVAYQRLFLKTGVALAPNLLVIGSAEYHAEVPPEDNQALQSEWENTFSWDGQLGQLLRANKAPLPSLLCASDALAWPVNPPRYAIRSWAGGTHGYVSTTGSYAWLDPIPNPNPAQRHITLTRKPLTPQTARSSGAVVVSCMRYDFFGPERWPQNTLIIREQVEEPPPPAEPPFIPPPNRISVALARKPLLAVLQQIEVICAERGITSVAIGGLWGMEDEADDLAWWRQQVGQIKKLTLHFECYGHLYDYGNAADVID